MKVAVIDDCQQDRDYLIEQMEQYGKEEKVLFSVDAYDSATTFLENLKAGEFFLIFLDIYLKDGDLNGMETARKIRCIDENVVIVFTTSSTEFAIEGYAVKASGYLVKPYTYEQFQKTMDNLRSVLSKEQCYIEVKEKRTFIKVLLNDIVYCDYDNHYIRIHTADRLIRSYMPFRELSEMLLEHEQFLCCYRNIIINMDKVRKMDANDFVMENEEWIPMRRPDKIELRQHYADYIFKKVNGGRLM